MKPLLEALALRPLERPPVWVMRQAGRYLPEYREIRSRHSFQEAVSTPEVAAEITILPIRRFAMDGAIVFADIMTPLEAMGVEMTFDPGPRLEPMTLGEVAELPPLDTDRVSFVGETIRRVKGEMPEEVAVIGFAGGPVTLLAYLLEGGGSRDFMSLRRAIHADPTAAREALASLGRAMRSYLEMQVAAGADVVQLFDTWANLLGTATFGEMAVPAARASLEGLAVPRIYFAPGSGHALELQIGVGADCVGVDWRLPLDRAWSRLGDVAIQGNLDPAVLLSDEATIRAAVARILDEAGGKPGHVFNLGHGIDRSTDPENVAHMVEAIRS